MSGLEGVCCVCVKSDVIIIKTEGKCDGEDGIVFLQQLRDCFPDIEWDDDSKICTLCYQHLQITYAFRESCLRSIELRRLYLEEIEKREAANWEVTVEENRIEEVKIEESTEAVKNSTRVTTDSPIKSSKTCTYCGRTFKRKQHLLGHVRALHTFEKPFQCDLCGKTFPVAGKLYLHKLQHDNERSYVCVFCGKKFARPDSLSKHNKTHENKRAYKCDGCEKTFNTASNLRTHKICVHADQEEWKYECSYCLKKFPLSSNLNKHLRRHTGEKKFSCGICGKSFFDKIMVQRHYSSHSNLRTFQCDKCDNAYKSEFALRKHAKTTHGLV